MRHIKIMVLCLANHMENMGLCQYIMCLNVVQCLIQNKEKQNFVEVPLKKRFPREKNRARKNFQLKSEKYQTMGPISTTKTNVG